MTRADYCPWTNEPCQCLCEVRCSTRRDGEPPRNAIANHAETSGSPIHDPKHPYVMKLIGCGHGVLFKDPCRECQIVGLQEEYRRAVKTIQRVRNELRRLGLPLPGQVAP